jgi:hypothetical protein
VLAHARARSGSPAHRDSCPLDDRLFDPRAPPRLPDVIGQFLDGIRVRKELKSAAGLSDEELVVEGVLYRRISGRVPRRRITRFDRPDSLTTRLNPGGLRGGMHVDHTAGGLHHLSRASQGMDHALGCHSSQRPRKQNDLEGLVNGAKCVDAEGASIDVRKRSREAADRVGVRIDRGDRGRVGDIAPRQPAIAAAYFENPARSERSLGIERRDFMTFGILVDRHFASQTPMQKRHRLW